MNTDVVLIDKPEGITSYDVIRRLKKDYPKGTKIGHTGTLDPFATGLLIILLGKECKKQDEYHKMQKTYLVSAIFNKETDTGDKTGKVINSDKKILNRKEIEDEIAKFFLGKLKQIPPKYSAKHVNGKRAYDLAREGIEFELKPNEVEVFSYDIIKFEWPMVEFKIVCGSGTYVRSLVSDLAIKLGTYAFCDSLRRMKIGIYDVTSANKLNEIEYES